LFIGGRGGDFSTKTKVGRNEEVKNREKQYFLRRVKSLNHLTRIDTHEVV